MKQIIATLMAMTMVFSTPSTADLLFPTNRKVGQNRLAFRSHCEPLVNVRLDPIINAAVSKTSEHVHTVMGARTFGPMVNDDSDFDQNKKTTCNVAQDMSMYWSPAMYYKNPESGLHEIVKTTHTHYYIVIGDGYMKKGNKLHVFPKGFRYIAGDNNDRTPGFGSDRASWHCIVDNNGHKKNLFLHDPKFSSLPPRFLKDGRECLSWQANFKFPTCWTGKSLDSTNHKDHMAFMTSFSKCPDTHPILLPQLLYQAEFHLGDIPKNAVASDFVLANGDSTMASFHADYIAGFDEKVLGGLIESCIRDKGANCAMSDVADNLGNSDMVPIKTMPNEKVDGIPRLLIGSESSSSSSSASVSSPPSDKWNECMQECRDL